MTAPVAAPHPRVRRRTASTLTGTAPPVGTDPSDEVRAPAASACPRAVPTRACAATASASRAKAAKFHSEPTTWCAASGTAPSAVAAHTVVRIAARRDTVRTSSGAPDPSEARSPVRLGARPTPASRADRRTGVASAAAIADCASAVPSPEPAIPIRAP